MGIGRSPVRVCVWHCGRGKNGEIERGALLAALGGNEGGREDRGSLG